MGTRKTNINGVEFEVEAWTLFMFQAKALEEQTLYYHHDREHMDAEQIAKIADTIVNYKHTDSEAETLTAIGEAIGAMAYRIIELERENKKLKEEAKK